MAPKPSAANPWGSPTTATLPFKSLMELLLATAQFHHGMHREREKF
jgi:hypothetical protein